MKNTTIGILALFLIGIVAAGAVSAFGMGRWGENKDAVRDAIEAKDFEAWKEAMTAGLTQERFDEIVERHENMPEWDGERGPGAGFGGRGMRGGMHRGMGDGFGGECPYQTAE